MATFVPDELIYESDLFKKNFRKFLSVMGLISTTQFFNLYRRYNSAENGGSFALLSALNDYMEVIIEEVYTSHGDLLKFSHDNLLVMWKINRDEFVSKMVHHVILCAQRIQIAVASLQNDQSASKVNVVLSAGRVTFSVIGDDRARHFVIAGKPIEELKYARRICLPGDLVLSSSAWDHCAPSQYEYVIKDSNNVKIIKVLGPPSEPVRRSTISIAETPSNSQHAVAYTPSEMSISSDISIDAEINVVHFQTRVSVVDALRRRIGENLKSYMLKPVMQQVQSEEPMRYLTEVRHITVVCVSVVATECTVYELISLIDELFKIVQNVMEKYLGCPCLVNLYEKDISFYIVFGARGYDSEAGDENFAKNGLLTASSIMRKTKVVAGVKTVLIGVATGLAFCGVVGHLVRRQYMIFGTPIDKAISLMMISFDKISCDYDTLYNSSLPKEKFRSRGLKILRRFGKCHIYEFTDTYSIIEAPSNLEYSYPILGCYSEVEYFKDILDDIGVSGRIYSGLLIEGSERSGKSRLLDAYVTIVRNRQIKLVQLSLHSSHMEKSYSVLYHMFLQLFDAEDCTSIEDRERVLLYTLSEVLQPENFCYLNTIMRVQFPVSEEYCEDSDWQRHKKTIEIFEEILNEVIGRVCILLDDAQYMDLLSWQFLSSALNNNHVVLVMTMMEPVSWDNLTQVEAGICQDKRLMNRTLNGLESKYLAAFACQFLNVIAIPNALEKILQQRSKNAIGWCEAFLMSALQVDAMEVVTISPMEAVHYDLVFPDQYLLSKIPAYLTPEELAPPLHWSQMSALNVCIPSAKQKAFVDPNRDVIGLRIDIYNRMNSYEQDFIKCAASLGSIFFRSMMDSAMVNATPIYTSRGKYDLSKRNFPEIQCTSLVYTAAVAEMIRFRILECAMIQRKYYHSDDSVMYVLKKRKTFSNMHHLVTCDCQPIRLFPKKTLPPYAYCKVLQFTIYSYRKLFYEILSPHEKRDYHTKAIGIFEKDARKCSTCGSGEFLLITSEEETVENSEEQLANNTKNTRRRTTFHSRHDRFDFRRSIFVDSNEFDKRRDTMNIRRISILPVHVDSNSDESSNGVREATRDDSVSDTTKRVKRSATILDILIDESWETRLRELSYVDYRNCRCMEVVSFLFWMLHYHIVQIKDAEKYAKFTMEYAAGLIQTGQPLYATKFLVSASDPYSNKSKEQLNIDISDSTFDKGRSLILMGDAYIAYGNYSQAKKFYTEAVVLRSELPQGSQAICYNILLEEILYKLRGVPQYTKGAKSQEKAAEKTELAISLQRLSMVSMLQNETKMAKLVILQSIRIIFEKIIVLVQIYQTIYESRVLRGKLKEGIDVGINICKMCNYVHLNNTKLVVLPSLIEIMVWTKQINAAVDLLCELYYLSKEDIDYSSITWYYALCMELQLDAAMILESYETCHDFYTNVIAFRSKTCVLRDPESRLRLTTCLVIWQLRMNVKVTDAFVKDIDEYLRNTTCDSFEQICNYIKGLECYLLLIQRRITIRKSHDLFDRIEKSKSVIKLLHGMAAKQPFIKPFLYLFQAYIELLRGRKSASASNILKSNKFAVSQENCMLQAWIEQNKRTWEEASYNNMAQYWVEHVGVADGVRWQEIESFSLSVWSTILFPLPFPMSTF
ncbi:PREDICTED: adenylate cyclase type 10-like [Eufriesea mexicana]|uniref:adenylate cyclase type 10-like n=1 Tax=Eufriesea mexicana TaxID=516756 RepID=UPI00083C1984|nr:PREDICTED: adenylate cyclase type 10-like [Eufriesea mexicana]